MSASGVPLVNPLYAAVKSVTPNNKPAAVVYNPLHPSARASPSPARNNAGPANNRRTAATPASDPRAVSGLPPLSSPTKLPPAREIAEYIYAELMKKFEFPTRPPRISLPMEKLGEGGFGSVFLINKRIVAKAVLMDTPRDELSFETENLSWKVLSQFPELKDNLPPYIGWSMYKYNDVAPHTREFKDKKAPSAVGVIYQKFIPVKTLADFVQYPSPLIPYKRAKALFDNLIRAFNVLHSHGFVHRDIKPQNVLIRTDGPLLDQPIIIDVGMLCKTPCKAKGLSGTLHYMPRNFFPAEMREEHLGSTPKYSVAERATPPIADRLAYFVARRLGRESAHPVKATRKAVHVVETPTSVMPNYTVASDNYALALTLEFLVAYTEITEESIEGIEIMSNIITKMKGEVIAEMAAAVAARRFPRPNFVDPRPGGSKRKSRRSRRRGSGTRRRKN